MLYRTLKRLMERGQTQGLGEKLDIFFAADKLTRLIASDGRGDTGQLEEILEAVDEVE